MPTNAFTSDGVLLLAQGETIKNQAQLDRLFQLDVVWVDAVQQPGGVVEPKRRILGNSTIPHKPLHDLQQDLNRFTWNGVSPSPIADSPQTPFPEEIATAQKVRDMVVQHLDQALQAIQSGNEIDLHGLNSMAMSVLQSIERNERAFASLLHLKAVDSYTFTHSVNCCILAILIARCSGLSGQALRKIGLSGLLHDIGKIKLPSAVIQKPGDLSLDEWTLVHLHPLSGMEIVQQAHGESDYFCSLEGISQHHERLDGQGYPHQLQNGAISLEGRLIAIADVYDAMTSDRCYRKAIPAPEVAYWLFSEAGRLFDHVLVHAFISGMGFFPVGTFVRLNTGEVALVVKTNRQAPLLPVVQIVANAAGKREQSPRLLDLAVAAQSSSRTIVACEDASTIDIDTYEMLGQVHEESLLSMALLPPVKEPSSIRLDTTA